MSLRYDSLDPDVRVQMLEEVRMDIKRDDLYLGRYLNAEGRKRWPEILMTACEGGTDEQIARTLRDKRLLLEFTEKAKPKGGTTIAKVPHTAPDMLAEGEFNRFYIRGLCLDVLAKGGSELEVYRGKQVSDPRPESEARIGAKVGAQKLLDDLRSNVGVDTALGVPAGPNSGLTVRRAH